MEKERYMKLVGIEDGIADSAKFIFPILVALVILTWYFAGSYVSLVAYFMVACVLVMSGIQMVAGTLADQVPKEKLDEWFPERMVV